MKETLLILQRVFGLLIEILGDLLGGWDGILRALFSIMAVDYITGLFTAIVSKNSFNRDNLCEIAKKLSIILLVAVGHVVDSHILQNENTARAEIVVFYLLSEVISVLENVILLGMPVPQKLRDILEQLKDEKSMK